MLLSHVSRAINIAEEVQIPVATLSRERGNGFLRSADRAVGIPIIFVVGLWRRAMRWRSQRIPERPATIGLLKASGIGDAMILSGVVADVRSRYPASRIILFSGTSNHAFARLLEGADEVVALPVRRPLDAVHIVRKYRPDVMIDFGMWPRFEALVASLSGARWVVGVRTPGQHRHFAYDTVVEHSTDHEIVNYRNLVVPLGVRSTQPPFIRSGESQPRPIDKPYVILHLWPGGSNAAERSWPVERWFTIARVLASRGDDVVLTGGPDDVVRTQELVAAWNAESLSVRGIAGLSAEETIVWLRHARGVLSVNTGLLHLAAAVGTPVVAINGPTSSKRWGPLGRHTRCVTSPMVPDGYLNLGWERDDRFSTCMDAIEPKAVLTAWDDLMREVAAEAGSPPAAIREA